MISATQSANIRRFEIAVIGRRQPECQKQKRCYFEKGLHGRNDRGEGVLRLRAKSKAAGPQVTPAGKAGFYSENKNTAFESETPAPWRRPIAIYT
jgi:hypothetical protein